MRVPTCCAVALALVAGAATADPNPSEAANCVAALKSRAEPYAERMRRGENDAEAQANFFEREFVQHKAQQRIEKLRKAS